MLKNKLNQSPDAAKNPLIALNAPAAAADIPPSSAGQHCRRAPGIFMTLREIISKIRKSKVCKTVMWSLTLSGLFLGVILLTAVYQIGQCEEKIYADSQKIPEREYALLLGTAKILRGKYLNPYFQYRIHAAAKLYHAGKIHKIIVSGDNRRHNYNEPQDMRQALTAAGVKDTDIIMDFAGFRTLDSVIRARSVFGVSKYTVVSQKFHCARAIFIANAHGLDVTGYAAQDVSQQFRLRRFIREPLACLLAWLDVNILNRTPYFEK